MQPPKSKLANTSLENVPLSNADRLEAFSDGVFSITITLLVLISKVRPQAQLLTAIKANRRLKAQTLAMVVPLLWPIPELLSALCRLCR